MRETERRYKLELSVIGDQRGPRECRHRNPRPLVPQRASFWRRCLAYSPPSLSPFLWQQGWKEGLAIAVAVALALALAVARRARARATATAREKELVREGSDWVAR
jgi:hypothetical protein